MRILLAILLTVLPVLLAMTLVGEDYLLTGPAGFRDLGGPTDALSISTSIASKTVVPTLLLIAFPICFLPRTRKGLRRGVVTCVASMVAVALVWGFLSWGFRDIKG